MAQLNSRERTQELGLESESCSFIPLLRLRTAEGTIRHFDMPDPLP